MNPRWLEWAGKPVRADVYLGMGAILAIAVSYLYANSLWFTFRFLGMEEGSQWGAVRLWSCASSLLGCSLLAVMLCSYRSVVKKERRGHLNLEKRKRSPLKTDSLHRKTKKQSKESVFNSDWRIKWTPQRTFSPLL
ncbi:hypothetical protein SK3146_06122 [Paenibacillus konkukensis]|uniref:Uncharacterized protein n=1 Tax=Paenibacillus konkukensis TaxID=2020716 RepID=A0ABY4RW00_9BACL|nr:hypothetical protein [Paenibacillus konkukensis]UQZ86829.1 hypothetical protein SK3146_06122 [Paenibacillus konkukensis]